MENYIWIIAFIISCIIYVILFFKIIVIANNVKNISRCIDYNGNDSLFKIIYRHNINGNIQSALEELNDRYLNELIKKTKCYKIDEEKLEEIKKEVYEKYKPYYDMLPNGSIPSNLRQINVEILKRFNEVIL